MAVEGSVVQARAGVVEATRDRVDLGAFVQQQFRSVDVAVHARVDKSVIHNTLPILRPRDGFEVSEWPIDLAGFGFQTSIRIEKAFDQIGTTEPRSDAQILHLRATLE